MKVGDLVKPAFSNDDPVSAPIVEGGWVGLIIGFENHSPRSRGRSRNPIVYWNPEFHSETEFSDQIEVLQCKSCQ